MTPEEIAFAHKQLRGPLCGSVCQNGALAIDTLLDENAALRAEVERLKTVPMKYRRMAFNAQLQDEANELRQQLAEANKERSWIRRQEEKS